MRRTRIAAAAGLAILVGGGAAALVATRGDSRPRPGRRLRVLFTGEALGALEPCNCSGKESGGLPALGGFVARQDGDHLLLDVGCLAGGARDFEVLRLQALLRGMARIGYDAANIGETELWLGKDALAALFALGVPFVSANVSDEAGEPVAERLRVFRRGGLKVAVTGLVASGRSRAGPGLVVDDPGETFARILPALRRAAGVIVVLADLSVEEVEKLVRDFPEITLALYRGRGDSRRPERVNRSVVAAVSGKLRYAGDVALSWDGGLAPQAEGVPVELDQRFPPSRPIAEASIAWYKQAIRGKRFDLGQPRPGWRRLAASQAAAGDTYLGSPACRECHEAAWGVWAQSRHRRAMASLERVGYEYSPECIVCHVVGYGASDGYVAKADTPALAGVGCECCHGRGARHVASKGKSKGSIVRAGEPACTPCHTPEHSRGFVFAKAWAKVAHKEDP